MADMKIEYEEVLARRKGQPPSPTAAVYPCSDDALIGAIEGGLIAPLLLGPKKQMCRHADPHARIFGLSLAALLTACLVLNAASPSTSSCQQSDRYFGTTGTDSVSASTRVVPALGGGSRVEPFRTIRSKECATNQGGEEPGY
jgi:hypothetical protein